MKENIMHQRNYNNFLGQIITELGFILWGMLAWVYMAGLFLVIGVIRELVFMPMMDMDVALYTSGVLSVLSVFLLAYYFMCCIQFPRNNIAFWVLGTVWVVLTVLFEYILQVQLIGHDVANLRTMFLFEGVMEPNIYIPVILPVFAAPWMLSQLRRNAGKRERAEKRKLQNS